MVRIKYKANGYVRELPEKNALFLVQVGAADLVDKVEQKASSTEEKPTSTKKPTAKAKTTKK